jgi:hypothetical protein
MSDFNLKTLCSRAQPGRSGPGLWTGLRGSEYGEAIVQELDRKTLAEEGSYFIANSTVATVITGHAAPVLVDADTTTTKPFIFLRNTDAATSRKLVRLDFIEIEVVLAGANGTLAGWSAQLDTGATRRSSGGTVLNNVNPNMQSSTTSVLSCMAGAVVSGVESENVRYIANGVIKPSIELAGDKKLFVFGEGSSVDAGVINMPPVILGPSDQLLLALYAPSQDTAGTYRVRMGWSER